MNQSEWSEFLLKVGNGENIMYPQNHEYINVEDKIKVVQSLDDLINFVFPNLMKVKNQAISCITNKISYQDVQYYHHLL